ncbi:hypothetical protein FCJ61_10170 [Burkholderia metallica]|nr:hypothetical protein [Burkholderia metallica]
MPRDPRGAAAVNLVVTATRLVYRGGHSLRIDNDEINGPARLAEPDSIVTTILEQVAECDITPAQRFTRLSTRAFPRATRPVAGIRVSDRR